MLPKVAEAIRWVKVMSVELESEPAMASVTCSSTGILSWFCPLPLSPSDKRARSEVPRAGSDASQDIQNTICLQHGAETSV